MQRELQGIYRLTVPLDVRDFVTTNACWLRHVTGATSNDIHESVLVRSCGEELDLSVYLDAALLERLREADIRCAGDGVELNDYCMALEGVSHFVYIAARALEARQTTAFELELQAEVDKYLVLTRLHDAHAGTPRPHVHRVLFETARLRADLDPVLLQRYGDASRYAGRYCRYLCGTYGAAGENRRGLDEELYYFYRLPQPEKVSHIERRG